MSLESSPEAAEPELERIRPKRWRGFLQRLGLGVFVPTRQREENDSVSNGSSTATAVTVNGSSGNAASADQKQWRTIADEVPEFLELGPQRPGGDPHFLAPDLDGSTPLLDDKRYRRALRALGDMELPSERVARLR